MPDAPTTYSARQALALSGLNARAVRYYVKLRLLPGAKPRGSKTIYSHEQVLRLRAIRLLRVRDRLGLPAIRKRFAKMSLADFEALVATDPANPPPPPPAPAPPAFAGPTWTHAELLPGLELRVRADVGEFVVRIAREIVQRYAAQPGA